MCFNYVNIYACEFISITCEFPQISMGTISGLKNPLYYFLICALAVKKAKLKFK